MTDDTEAADGRRAYRYRAEPYKNPDRLRELYAAQGLSQREIATRFGVSQRTISYWIEQYGIKPRDPSVTGDGGEG
jgi:transposase